MAFYDYPALATSEHKKPKFLALLDAITAPYGLAMGLLASLPKEFDVDFATGVQLDIIGLWVGIGRWLEGPLAGVYFTWDEDGPGWDKGVWKGRYDPDTGLTRLGDAHFRRLIKARIAANHWDGTTNGACAVWAAAFADTGSLVVIQDNQDMSMIVGITGMYPDALTRALLTGGYLPLKPEGVRVSYYTVAPDGGRIFAWDCDSEALAGWSDEKDDGGRWAEFIAPRKEA